MSEGARHHPEATIVKAFVLIGVVVLVGFFLARYVMNALNDESSGGQVYNGFEFARNGNFWVTEWQRPDGTEFTLEFRHPPWEVEVVPVTGSVDERFSDWPHVFITHDPSFEASRASSFVAISAADLAGILKNVFGKNVIAACSANLTAACEKRPIVDCSSNASVVYLKVSNSTGIALDGNCVTFQGVEDNMTRAVNKGIYEWLGIMKK